MSASRRLPFGLTGLGAAEPTDGRLHLFICLLAGRGRPSLPVYLSRGPTGCSVWSEETKSGPVRPCLRHAGCRVQTNTHREEHNACLMGLRLLSRLWVSCHYNSSHQRGWAVGGDWSAPGRVQNPTRACVPPSVQKRALEFTSTRAWCVLYLL